MLLGVHCGQYPEQVQARKIKKATGEAADDIVRDRDNLKIPSSMAVVVPAWEIVNLLNQPFFTEIRRRRIEMKQRERDKQNIPEPEATLVEQPASGDANPNHLADFTRLVDVAGRKRPQDDQT